MSSSPRVSIVMPSYNSERHIAESIQSIINQTYSDWEFIIVDGHSTDRTIEIVNSFIKKDSRIKLIFDDKKGIGPALNLGCKLARGEYIARMDTDDVSLEKRLEKEVKYLDKHPKTVLVSCSAQYIDEDGDVIGYMFPYTHPAIIKRCATSVLHPGVMMKKRIFESSGGYPPIKRAEDLMLWYKFMRFGKIKILNAPLLKYRLSDTALSNSMSPTFLREVNGMWKKYAKEIYLSDESLKEIELFINKNAISYNYRSNPINSLENVLYNKLCMFLNRDYAGSVVFLLKNIYGFFKL